MLFPVEAGLRPHWRGDSSPNFPYLCSQGEVWRLSPWVPINAPATSTFQCEIVSERDRIRNDPDESCPSLSRLTSGETASPSHLPWSPRQGRTGEDEMGGGANPGWDSWPFASTPGGQIGWGLRGPPQPFSPPTWPLGLAGCLASLPLPSSPLPSLPVVQSGRLQRRLLP